MSNELLDAVRVLRIELGIANNHVANAASLNPRDLDVLDVIDREGPCSPSAVATKTGIPRATLTGVLARLQTQGWLVRNPDPSDQRAAELRSTNRFGELEALYAAANQRLRALEDAYTAEELSAIVRFLHQVAAIAREAGAQLDTPHAQKEPRPRRGAR